MNAQAAFTFEVDLDKVNELVPLIPGEDEAGRPVGVFGDDERLETYRQKLVFTALRKDLDLDGLGVRLMGGGLTVVPSLSPPAAH